MKYFLSFLFVQTVKQIELNDLFIFSGTLEDEDLRLRKQHFQFSQGLFDFKLE
jgi:hypothetical protein